MSSEGSNFKVKIESGIELMELEVLAGASDTQILDSELALLEEQYKAVLDSLISIESSKAASKEVFELMSGKTATFAIAGLLVVVGMNLVFYRVVRKSLRERKRI